MEYARVARATSPAIPPGCLFCPSEEQLLGYYLTAKNATANGSNAGLNGYAHGYDVIKDINLYEYDPFELPDISCFPHGVGGKRKYHWFCYTSVVFKEQGGRMRWGKNGFWMKKGLEREVVDQGGSVLGTKSCFTFCFGNSAEEAAETPWVLQEYALSNNVQAAFVLCHVYFKGVCRNNTVEDSSTSSGEESTSTVVNNYYQNQNQNHYHYHQNYYRNYYQNYYQNCYINCDIAHITEEVGSRAHDRNAAGPAPDDLFELYYDAQQNQRAIRALSPEQMRAIIEGNYIELDDLVD